MGDFRTLYGGWLSPADPIAAVLSGWSGAVIIALLVAVIALCVVIARRVAAATMRREMALQTINDQFDSALRNISQGLCLYDANDRLVVVNSRFRDIYGFSADQVKPGVPFDEVVRLGIKGGHFAGRSADSVLWDRLGFVSRRIEGTIVQDLADGRVVSVFHRPTGDGGWLATYEDITEQRRAEKRLVYLARHDSLTGLPNRTNFNERLEWALTQVGRGAKFALMYVDVDRFRGFNDTYGHAAGDALLQSVGRRLEFCIRETDVVARLHSDEFAILQVGPERPEDASTLAERIIREMRLPHDVGGLPAMASVSIGISLAPQDGTMPGKLVQFAEEAMYRAKVDGPASYRLFEPEMDARLHNQRQLEHDLRTSLAQAQFELHYQPLFNVRSGKISGYEALLRWNHPTRGMVPPADFIPIAEDSGLIVPLGEWVLRQACLDAMSWPAEVRVAVNLSPVQFRSKVLLSAVISALQSSGLPASRLELEVTETLMLDRTEAALDVLREFRRMGAKVAMDDFGTGYSSLSYLRDFPFDKIKIDRSFIKDLLERRECLAIVHAIISLAAQLGIRVVAEGVQNDEQLRVLREAGCDEVQSFLLGRPMPAREIPFHLARIERAA